MLVKIAVDERLIQRAQEITGIESKEEAVQEALRALISIQDRAQPGDSQSKTR